MSAPRSANATYRVLAGILRPLLFAMTRRDWQGSEHLPSEGGFIVAANHMTNFDPLTFAHYVYDQGVAPKILAKASLFKVPVLGWALRKTEMIPVFRQTSKAGDSLGPAVEALREGECVAVFPEGTLTREPDLWPMTGKTGVARIALTAQVPVIPVAQWGAQNILPRYSKRFRPFPRKRVWVIAGPPVDLSDLYDRPQDTATLREATERVMAAITQILEGIRGQKAPEVRYDMREALRAAKESNVELIGPSRGTPAMDERPPHGADEGSAPDPANADAPNTKTPSTGALDADTPKETS